MVKNNRHPDLVCENSSSFQFIPRQSNLVKLMSSGLESLFRIISSNNREGDIKNIYPTK